MFKSIANRYKIEHNRPELNVSLPDKAKLTDLSNILVEPSIAANIPKHVLVSSVFQDNHTVVQVMNIILTAEASYLRWHQVRGIYPPKNYCL